MTSISEAYQQHRIMPSLQLHQLRVAAVAWQLVAAFTDQSFSKDNTILACLVHDMGNICKFDLAAFPSFVEPEGLTYWQTVQQEFKDQYGSDEHQATLRIVAELGIDKRVAPILSQTGFLNIMTLVQTGSWEAKVVQYSDLRVTPQGVVTLEQRLLDLQNRYQAKYPGLAQEQKRQQFAAAARNLETELIQKTGLDLSKITDQSGAVIIETLKKFVV